MTTVHELRVSSGTPVRSLSSAIIKAFTVDKADVVQLRYIGAGAGHQATKAVTSANASLSAKGYSLIRQDFWLDFQTAEGVTKSANVIRLYKTPIILDTETSLNMLNGNTKIEVKEIENDNEKR